MSDKKPFPEKIRIVRFERGHYDLLGHDEKVPPSAEEAEYALTEAAESKLAEVEGERNEANAKAEEFKRHTTSNAVFEAISENAELRIRADKAEAEVKKYSEAGEELAIQLAEARMEADKVEADLARVLEKLGSDEFVEAATRRFTSIHWHNAPLKYGGHARQTMKDALEFARIRIFNSPAQEQPRYTVEEIRERLVSTEALFAAVGENEEALPWDRIAKVALDAAFPQPHTPTAECDHDWFDPTNPQVEADGHVVCRHCGAIRAAALSDPSDTGGAEAECRCIQSIQGCPVHDPTRQSVPDQNASLLNAGTVFAASVERDRREPDKVLCHLQTFKRALADASEQGEGQ